MLLSGNVVLCSRADASSVRHFDGKLAHLGEDCQALVGPQHGAGVHWRCTTVHPLFGCRPMPSGTLFLQITPFILRPATILTLRLVMNDDSGNCCVQVCTTCLSLRSRWRSCTRRWTLAGSYWGKVAPTKLPRSLRSSLKVGSMPVSSYSLLCALPYNQWHLKMLALRTSLSCWPEKQLT